MIRNNIRKKIFNEIVSGAAEMKKLSLVWESDSGFSLISLMEIKSGLSPLTTCVNIMVGSRMAYIVRTLINVWLYLYKP